LWFVGIDTRFHKPPKKEVARWQIARSRWPIPIAIVWDNTARKFFSLQLHCFARSVTGCAVLLKLHAFHMHTVQLRPQKLRYHVAITYAIHCYCISTIIFEKVRPNHSTSPKSTPNSGSLCMQWLFMNHSRILRTRNPTVLCVHVPIKLKALLIAKDDFLRKIAVHVLVPAESWGTFVGYCVPQLIAVCVLYTEIKISALFE